MDIESVIKNLRVEVGKLKGLIEKLREDIKLEKLDRNKLKNLLFDLKPSLLSFKNCTSEFLDFISQESVKKSPADALVSLFEVFVNVNTKQKILQEIESHISQINSLVSYDIDKPEWYKDVDVKNRIYSFITYLESIFSILDKEVFRPLSLSITGFSKLAELITEKPMGLDENWAAANCYLSAMEIVINKKSKELGLAKEEIQQNEKGFNKKFNELLNSLEKRGVEVTELEKQLPQTFWKIRHKVVHGGYSPKQEELELITNWSRRIINVLIKS